MKSGTDRHSTIDERPAIGLAAEARGLGDGVDNWKSIGSLVQELLARAASLRVAAAEASCLEAPGLLAEARKIEQRVVDLATARRE